MQHLKSKAFSFPTLNVAFKKTCMDRTVHKVATCQYIFVYRYLHGSQAFSGLVMTSSITINVGQAWEKGLSLRCM